MARIARLGVATVGTRSACAAAALFVLLLLVVGTDPATASAPAARVVSHGSRAEKTIALTFDDGASPANCRRILAELVGANVPATFFPMSSAIRLDPAFWRLVARAGYPIADHTVTHPHMPRLGYAAQVRQMTESRAAIESTIGRPMLNVFRPPYGEYDAVTLAAAGAAGFPTLLLWDASDRDTSPRGTVAEMQAAAERGTNGSVILLHCGPNATPYLLPNVIASYRSRGFRFVTIPDLLRVRWKPGQTAPLTQAEILSGLSPLPPSSGGGAVVGTDGTVPGAASAPPGSPSGSPPPPASSVPSASSARPTLAPSAGLPAPLDTPSAASAPRSAAEGAAPLLAVGVLGLLVVAVLAASHVLRRGRR